MDTHHVHAHTRHTHTHTWTQVHIPAHTRAHVHNYTHTTTQAHNYTRTQPHNHTTTHAYAYTRMCCQHDKTVSARRAVATHSLGKVRVEVSLLYAHLIAASEKVIFTGCLLLAADEKAHSYRQTEVDSHHLHCMAATMATSVCCGTGTGNQH